MTWSTLDGEPVTHARVTIPWIGLWVAEVELAISQSVSTAPTLVMGDLTLKGTVFRVDDFAGSRKAIIGGGALGWRKTLTRKMYSQPGGVLVSTVLKDAAAEVGETIVVAADQGIGDSFVRQAQPAVRVLELLAPSWWIDPSGVTHTGSRDLSQITSHFDVIDYQGAKGKAEIATEVLADWTPGRTFVAPTIPSPLTVGSVTHTATNDGTSRLEALVSAAGDGQSILLDGLRALIRERFPREAFMGVYEYTVQAVNSGVVDAYPVDTTLTLPPVRAAIAGVHGSFGTPSAGSVVEVYFLNGDPSRPRIRTGVDVDALLIAGGSGTQFVARQGDLVGGGIFAITGPCSLKVKCG